MIVGDVEAVDVLDVSAQTQSVSAVYPLLHIQFELGTSLSWTLLSTSL